MRSYRPGDFLLTRSDGSLARLTGLATGGDLNHAALIVDPSGGLIEVNPSLALAAGPLRRSHIHQYQEAGAPCWIGYVELVEGTREAVVEFAEQHLATQSRLSEVGVAILALNTLLCVAPRARTARHAWLKPLAPIFDRHALVLREEHTHLAGEFVARALERGGFHWGADPAYITPAALFDRFHMAEDEPRGVLVTLAQARRARHTRSSVHRVDQGPAQVRPFIPRTTVGRQGAALRVVAPQPVAEATPDGLRALAQLALLTLSGLALVEGLEMALRAFRDE
jgi:hypothetical protein